ncbi:bifunctional homocysteine S-methyltransferase/methylenetetrahydrofolate reductase [Alicyclobacillus sp. SP_1]|uniref:bifunctional homocysteine S-methyltransferase/methylenetetrahydrofolate reductase n=1 Tax=Alicyclobacillus sp. SP_1 TaxID=2942475 RepID=UPI002157931B|nr:bifunctional homocysteine S-methyltransferase/methylenetetrahydrofolate reductase [Alicyclobacillus sp. SP_1]
MTVQRTAFDEVPSALVDSSGHRTILLDGAMATFLHQVGVPVGTVVERLNVERPEQVRHVHRAYIQAGSTLIQTNTFGANRSVLARSGLDVASVVEFNRSGAKLALEAAGEDAKVLGTVGPALSFASPHIETLSENQLRAVFREQMEALLGEPVFGLILETFAELETMLVALDVARSLTDKPVIANLSPDEVGVTRDGYPLAEALGHLHTAGAAAVGLNCKLGPNGILRSYEQMQRLPDILYTAVPNAGILQLEESEYSYKGNASYFAATLAQMHRLGVQLLGGCCGTTPQHIAALRDVLKTECRDGGPALPSVGAVSPAHETNSLVTVKNAADRTETPSGLLQRVQRETTVIVELDPPKTLQVHRFLQGAKALSAAGADYITLADNSLGSIRISNMAMAALLKQSGVEPLVHVTCRDRNLIGQQSHLMGLHALGVHHVLLVTGDPSRFGDLPGATSVYDVSSIELTKMVKRLNAGIGFSGVAMDPPANFVVGTSFNPHVRHLDKALERLRRKIEAGADFVMTQPVFEERLVERLALATKEYGVPVFVGVMPLVSWRNASFLHHEVPGIQIPEHVLNRMANCSPDRATDEGMAIAKATIDEIRDHFRGVYLVTPFLRYSLTVELTTYIKGQQA